MEIQASGDSPTVDRSGYTVLVEPLAVISASRDSGEIVKPYSRDQLSNALEFGYKHGVSKASSYLPAGFHTLTMHLTMDGLLSTSNSCSERSTPLNSRVHSRRMVAF